MRNKTVSVLLTFLFFVNIAICPQTTLADTGKSHLRPLSLAESNRPLNIRVAAFQRALSDHLFTLYQRSEDAQLGEQDRNLARSAFNNTLKLIATTVNPSNNLVGQFGLLTEQETKTALAMLRAFSERPFDETILRDRLWQAAVIMDRERIAFKTNAEGELEMLRERYDPIMAQLGQLARQSGLPMRHAAGAASEAVAPAHAPVAEAFDDFVTRVDAVVLRVSPDAMRGRVVELNRQSRDPLAGDARIEAGTKLHRMLKLVAACNGDTGVLARSGPLRQADVDRVLGQLSDFETMGFSDAELQRLVLEAGRARTTNDDDLRAFVDGYQPAIDELLTLAQARPAVGVRAADAGQPVPAGRRQASGQAGITGLTPAEMRAKVRQLGVLRAGIQGNEFGRAAWVGDQHGQNEVLKRVAEAALANELDEVVIHGDQFDRGKQNVMNFMALEALKFKLGNRAVLCFGNHDILMIQALLLGDERAAGTWLTNGGANLVEEFRAEGRNPRDLALFMLKNFKLFHVDERGFLHLHAGIRMDNEGNPLISMEQLNAWQKELEAIQEQLRDNPDFLNSPANAARLARLFSMDEGAGNIVWDRMDRWVNKFAGKVTIDEANKRRLFAVLRQLGMDNANIEANWERLLVEVGPAFNIEFSVDRTLDGDNIRMMDRFLAKLGVNGIIFGHEWQPELMNVDNRIMCLDVHKGDNGFVIFNGDGVRFNALASSQESPVASNAELLANIDGQLVRMKEAMGEDTRQEQQMLAADSSRVSEDSQRMARKLAERQQNPAYEKAAMRYNSGLRIGWGEGTFELFARQSTQMPGALRISDIKGLGRNIARVVTLDGTVGDSLLVEEGQSLRIGPVTPLSREFALLRDTQGIPLGYALAVGNRNFYFKQEGNEIVLVEQAATLVEGQNFAMSRTISNGPDSVSVEFGRGSASQTTIKQEQLAPETEQDLTNRLLEIMRLMSIVPVTPGMVGLGQTAVTSGPGLTIMPNSLDEVYDREIRLIVAMVIATEGWAGGRSMDIAAGIIQGNTDWRDIIQQYGVRFDEAFCQRYQGLRVGGIESFRRVRTELAQRVGEISPDLRATYFGSAPASAMNLLAAGRGDFSNLISAAQRSAVPSAAPSATRSFNQLLDEEKRFVVAMVLVLDGRITKQHAARLLLDESISFEQWIKHHNYSFKNCVEAYMQWRNPATMDRFRGMRQDIADMVRIDGAAYQKYFGQAMSSVMNRLGNSPNLDYLIGPQQPLRPSVQPMPGRSQNFLLTQI